jgi:hypothetical protein
MWVGAEAPTHMFEFSTGWLGNVGCHLKSFIDLRYRYLSAGICTGFPQRDAGLLRNQVHKIDNRQAFDLQHFFSRFVARQNFQIGFGYAEQL